MTWRGRPAGVVLALGPAVYTAYMFAQYIAGPAYQYYPRVLTFHLALFVLAGSIGTSAWSATKTVRLPMLPHRQARRHAIVLVLLAAFVVSRYVPALIDSWNDRRLAGEHVREPAMYWSVVLLDLGVVVPVTVAAAGALWRSARDATKLLYGVVGCFALVPPSVAAMGITEIVNSDPEASVSRTVCLGLAALVFALYAVWLDVRLARRCYPRPQES